MAGTKKVPYGCGLSEKMYQTCVSSGGCCQGTNCLFGKCKVVAPPSKKGKATTLKDQGKQGAILGQIMPERTNEFNEGFGDNEYGSKYKSNSKNWARLWTGKKPTKGPHVRTQTMSAIDFLRDTGEGSITETKTPTTAPTILFWDHDSIGLNTQGSGQHSGATGHNSPAYMQQAMKEALAEQADSIRHLGNP
jgi:hypothetical protein